ncbi:arsenic-transporting ATPase [Aphanothece hegewaldii CCALA 016]|uniref:Arsenic-transporting ATPase n=1 Tax=Aphanothece hegewaldii CCALA 016 TaxID=2107694 RepID=A0A2T1M3A8_9CHRO|nr:ArsA family ATPase [Aphanothece hegewaldii]PSF39296.1 arsenic-transporting ATPase [Aphanothece hegewaldii CCALA 016]
MTLILTFLGKGGSGRSTMAIAAAKQLANTGVRVLLVGQDPSPAWGMLLEVPPSASPIEIAPNLAVVQLVTTVLLERNWEEVKELEKKYLRSPILKNVYGQELGILPGMDNGLALNALREYEKSGKYDAIVYDGTGDLNMLRMLGIPEVTSWYVRRFRKVFADSDLGRAISPFIQPLASTIFNVSLNPEDWVKDPNNPANNILEEGKAVMADPSRFAAYLVTTDDPISVATAKYLWGSAQQIGLSVKGVLLNQGEPSETITNQFTPLSVIAVQSRTGSDWNSVIDALPNFRESISIPQPLTIDSAARQVKVFLPGFDKKQVKLTQFGPEITIEAGDQRRNINVPAPLSGQSVKGAKFQDGYLIISF